MLKERRGCQSCRRQGVGVRRRPARFLAGRRGAAAELGFVEPDEADHLDAVALYSVANVIKLFRVVTYALT